MIGVAFAKILQMPLGVPEIKKLVVMALASDEELMEHLVLKGGNAIELIQHRHDRLSRASNDIDFSMEDSFDDQLEAFQGRIQRTINDTFSENGLVVFDFHFSPQPREISDDVKDIWGGYKVSFKLSTPENVARANGDHEKLQRMAVPFQSNGSPKIEIDISKFEYVAMKQELAVNGVTIYIYSPEMIVFEKLRAICQQHPDYSTIIPGRSARARARDFYDIRLLVDQFKIDPQTSSNKELIRAIFAAKRVPLDYIREIKNHLDIHRADWPNLVDTLPASERADLMGFDAYARFVVDLFEALTFL